jgi:hypothetical protein
VFIFFVCLWAHFCGSGPQKPGYPLQFLSFTFGKAFGISASIPCAVKATAGC